MTFFTQIMTLLKINVKKKKIISKQSKSKTHRDAPVATKLEFIPRVFRVITKKITSAK